MCPGFLTKELPLSSYLIEEGGQAEAPLVEGSPGFHPQKLGVLAHTYNPTTHWMEAEIQDNLELHLMPALGDINIVSKTKTTKKEINI